MRWLWQKTRRRSGLDLCSDPESELAILRIIATEAEAESGDRAGEVLALLTGVLAFFAALVAVLIAVLIAVSR